MLIHVKTLTGKKIDIDVDPDKPVRNIKEKIEVKEGIPPPQQRLIFGGKHISEEEKSVEDYCITAGSVLHLVLALRGGI